MCPTAGCTMGYIYVEVIHPDLFSVQLWLCSYLNSSDQKECLEMRRSGCHRRGMFRRAALAGEGLPLAFHKSFQALSLRRWLADLPVPVWFFISPLLASVFALCFTVNHRGKPGPLPRVLFVRFHGSSWCFAVSPWGQAELIPCFLSGVCYPTHSSAFPPPFAQEIFFFRMGAWSCASSNRDLPVYPFVFSDTSWVALSFLLFFFLY